MQVSVSAELATRTDFFFPLYKLPESVEWTKMGQLLKVFDLNFGDLISEQSENDTLSLVILSSQGHFT